MPDFPSLSLDDLPGLLAHIAADCDRDTWVTVAMGVKAEFGENGYQDFDAWSQGGHNYKHADALAVWKSCKGGSVTIGSVIHLAKDGGWRPQKLELTAEEARAKKAESEARRQQRQAEIEADEARLAVMQQQVQQATLRIINEHTSARGKSPYLDRKQVAAFGIRFMQRKVLLTIDDQRQCCDLWVGNDIHQFFQDLPKPRPDHISFLKLDPGSFLVPLADVDGEVWSFQVINAAGTKLFPKFSKKQGCMHVIGSLPGAEVIALAEGYATAASVAMATDWPTVMTVDVGNMVALAKVIRQRYPESRIVLAGDDDPTTKGNPGRTKAEQAAMECGALAVFPESPGDIAA